MTEDALDRQASIAMYLDAVPRLEAILDGLDEAILDRAPAEGGWSIRQIVHHLVDGDHLWTLYIKAALGNPDAVLDFAWYWFIPQVAWAERWNYAGRAVEPSLALFRANRCQVAQILDCLPGAWDCSASIQWPEQVPERMSVGEVIALQARHAMGHMDDIERILTNE